MYTILSISSSIGARILQIVNSMDSTEMIQSESYPPPGRHTLELLYVSPHRSHDMFHLSSAYELNPVESGLAQCPTAWHMGPMQGRYLL